MNSVSTSLLQDVLRPSALGPGMDKFGLTSRLAGGSTKTHLSRDSSPTRQTQDDSDDEIIGVMSMPGSPSRSGAPSRQTSRPSSPTRMGANRRKVPGPLLLSKSKERSTDPLRAFPTDVSQRIFGLLSIRDLARCARVCRKWSKSQTLNYVWFQQYRKDSFHDEDLPAGKWTRRESKQNWRQTYMKVVPEREGDLAGTSFVSSRSSRPASPFNNTLSFANIMSEKSTSSSRGSVSHPGSGYVTPKEAREEAWKQEAEQKDSPTKNEMREMYKELGGRKARGKGKFGATTRDKGGWEGSYEDGF